MPRVPPAVRVLPMSRKLPGFAAWDAAAVQREFFLCRLPEGGGRFHFTTTALQAEPGTILLFQYTGRIVALAELLETIRFAQPQLVHDNIFCGAYQLDPLSIRTFRPVDAAHLQKFWPKLPGLGQAKHRLAPAPFLRFARSLREVCRPG